MNCANFTFTFFKNTPKSNSTPFELFMCPCSGRGEARRSGGGRAVRGRSNWGDGHVWGSVWSAGKGKKIIKSPFWSTLSFLTKHCLCRGDTSCRLCLCVTAPEWDYTEWTGFLWDSTRAGETKHFCFLYLIQHGKTTTVQPLWKHLDLICIFE